MYMFAFYVFCLFQGELKHSTLGLCSLFTFKQAFGQLQQVRKKMDLKTHSSYIIY